jgi:3-dehydroquinate dehydratase-2
LRIGVLHGPNLNLLGRRDPAHYGELSLEEIGRLLEEGAAANGAALIHTQSNHEGVLIDWIHEHMDDVDGWLVNPAALGHTSYALRDALEASAKPFVEVHLSDVSEREPFRRHSVLADIAIDVVVGLRADGYRLALDVLVAHLKREGGEVE